MRAAIFLCVCAILAALHYVHSRRKEKRHDACFSFDLSPAAERFRQRSGHNEADARLVEIEFRRFFWLMALHPERRWGLHNGAIDDFWHELICCTALYEAFCQEVAGRFIHHDPAGGGGQAYAHTWWAYRKEFGEEPDLAWWPPAPEGCTRPNSGDGGCGGGSCGGGH